MSARELAITALLLAASRDLAIAWRDDPFVSAGPLAALLWGAAVGWARARHEGHGRRRALRRWRTAGVGLAVLGAMLEVRALVHLALAAWLCSASRHRVLLWTASVAWMPLLGRLPYAPGACNVLRLALAALALAGVARSGGGDDDVRVA